MLRSREEHFRLKSLFGPTTCDLSHHDTDDEFSFRHRSLKIFKSLTFYVSLYICWQPLRKIDLESLSFKMIQGFKHTFHRTGQQKQKYIGSRVKGLKYLGHNLRQVLNKKEKSFLTLKLVLFLWERILDTKLWHNK